MKKIQYMTLLIALSFGLITLAPAFAAAQTGVSATVSASGAASAGTALTAAQTKAISRADTEITRRITALTDLNTRIQAMQKVTDSFKTSVTSSITSEINSLTTLKQKIDADTDSATLKTDIQSIATSYRVFALALPQGRIAAAADRQVTLVSMMTTLGSKLQARINAAGQAGADTTALTAALTDMATKLKDAQTKAEGAVTSTASLSPDNGDKTLMASNTAALKQARTDLKTGESDLVAARKDVTTIVTGLGKIKPATTASSTTSTAQ